MGHSMGGHGALTLGLRNPGLYRSISAFSPIAHPSVVPWGEKAFGGYLDGDRAAWKQYDATELVRSRVQETVSGGSTGFCFFCLGCSVWHCEAEKHLAVTWVTTPRPGSSMTLGNWCAAILQGRHCNTCMHICGAAELLLAEMFMELRQHKLFVRLSCFFIIERPACCTGVGGQCLQTLVRVIDNLCCTRAGKGVRRPEAGDPHRRRHG